jgi:hypothetical protein
LLVSQPDLQTDPAGEVTTLYRPSCSALAATADAESSTSLARNVGAGIVTGWALPSKPRVPWAAVCTRRQGHGRSLERCGKLEVRCHSDLCLQSLGEVAVARGAENMPASFFKSLKLIALPWPR